MFDISFTELMIIGLVALVVIGPERLPKVARTLGHLLGRAQRYVHDVKTDIKREIDAGDLNNIKNQFDEAASSVKASLDDASRTISNPMQEAQKAVENAGKTLQASVTETEPRSSSGSGGVTNNTAAQVAAAPTEQLPAAPRTTSTDSSNTGTSP